MKTVFNITFNGRNYPARPCYHRELKEFVTIGSNSLDMVLFESEGRYPNSEAEEIDNTIYGYVPDDVLINYSDDDFEDYVNEFLD